MQKVHLIMPMGGAGSRFFKNGFTMPKPLIEINGYPFLYWSTISITNFMPVSDVTFVVLKQHIEEFNIDKVIKKYFPDAKIVVIPKLLNGAVLTCLKGVENINDDMPIVFNDCDHLFLCNDFYNYCKAGNFAGVDGALLTFTSNDPKYSFLELNEFGNVTRTVEKQAISTSAICGAYYFRDKNIFEKSTEEYLKECAYSEYFVSGVYNVMAKNHMIIKNFTCDLHLPFGTPDEYEKAKDSEGFKRVLK